MKTFIGDVKNVLVKQHIVEKISESELKLSLKQVEKAATVKLFLW